ncbi:MAG: hypothetical protein ACXQS3_02160 [Candidatus Methanofastidiosia archaeon]
MGKYPILALLILILVVGSCACIDTNSEEETPEDIIRIYYDGLNERDAQKIIRTLSSSVIDSAGGEKAILEALNDTFEDLETINLIFEIENISSHITGLSAIVDADLKIYPKGSTEVSRIPYSFKLIFENEKWKICDIG